MDDLAWLSLAVDLARLCPPSSTAFSVGAVVVGSDGVELARGYSRETDPYDHAEEAALRKLRDRLAPRRPGGDSRLEPDEPGGGDLARDNLGGSLTLAGATVYSSLEPCSKRASRPKTCTQLILAAGVGRVVFAWREPPVFVDGDGSEILRAAGVTVVELPELAEAAKEPNAHLL